MNVCRVRGSLNRRTHTHNRAGCPLAVLLAICCCLSAVSGQWLETTQPVAPPQPGFDPKDAVRQIRSVRPGLSSDGREQLPDSGEFLIDTSITYVPARRDQLYPAVAFDGVNFLVVWQDFRGYVFQGGVGECGSGKDIYGARVTPQGLVLDSVGFVIARAPRNQCSPAVSFDGTDFLVVWQDDRDNSGWDIYGARVTRQGAVLDSIGFVISQAANDQQYPAVGFDGTDFLVVWVDARDGPGCDIYGARVTSQGTVLDTAGIVISQAEQGQDQPAVGFDGSNFLVAWEDSRNGSWRDADIYGARVTSQGIVLDSAGLAISQAAGRQNQAAVAFDGTSFLVVWDDSPNDTSWDIYGARVTPQGTVLDTAGIAISQAVNNQRDPAVAFDGADFLVVWEDGDLYGARVTSQGVVLDTAGIVISEAPGDQLSTAVGFDGADFLVVWRDGRSGIDFDIYGARMTPQGAVLDSVGVLISYGPHEQRDPAVASDGANFLVVWEDFRNNVVAGDIYGARVTPGGTVLDPNGFAISTAAGGQFRPSAAFDGSNYLVVWNDYRDDPYGADIYGARVTPQGAVLDTAGIAISRLSGGERNPALAFGGANFLVVWEYGDIYGARVTPQGVVLDTPGIEISPAPGYWEDRYAAVGFDGTNFLVVWTRCPWPGNVDDIYGARVTPQGIVLDSAGIAISRAEKNQTQPVTGFDGANFLVVWEDYRNNVYDADIYGARVTPQGTVLDTAGIGIALIPYSQQNLAMDFDGTNYLVVWQDFRSGSFPGDADIYGARVTPGGTVFDCGSVVTQEGMQMYPSICCGNGGQMLLAYQGWAGTVGGKGYNTYRIWGKVDPNPAIAEMTKSDVRRVSSGATIVRGVLFLQGDRRPGTGDRAALLDISGRKVFDLKSGANDVRALPPGVYFVKGPETEDGRPVAVVRKVVVAR